MLQKIKIRTFNKNGVDMIDMRLLNREGNLSKTGIFIERDEVPQLVNQLKETIKKHDNEENRIINMTKKLEDFWTTGC